MITDSLYTRSSNAGSESGHYLGVAIQCVSRKRREVGFIEKENSDLVLRRGRKSDDYAAQPGYGGWFRPAGISRSVGRRFG